MKWQDIWKTAKEIARKIAPATSTPVDDMAVKIMDALEEAFPNVFGSTAATVDIKGDSWLEGLPPEAHGDVRKLAEQIVSDP